MDLDELSLDLLLSDFLRQFSFEYKPGKATTTPQSGHWCCRLFHFQLVAQLSQKPNYHLPNYRFSQSLRGAISSVMVAGSTDADQFVATFFLVRCHLTKKTLPEAQRTQKLTPRLGLNLATTWRHLN